MRALVLAAALAGCAAHRVYYRAGTYHTLEVLLAETRSGAMRRERAPISETP